MLAGWLTGTEFRLELNVQSLLVQRVVVFYEADDWSLLLWDLQSTKRMILRALWVYWTFAHNTSEKEIGRKETQDNSLRGYRNGSHVCVVQRECLFQSFKLCLSVAGHNASLDLKGKTQINMQLHFVWSMVLYFNNELLIKEFKTLIVNKSFFKYLSFFKRTDTAQILRNMRPAKATLNKRVSPLLKNPDNKPVHTNRW